MTNNQKALRINADHLRYLWLHDLNPHKTCRYRRVSDRKLFAAEDMLWFWCKERQMSRHVKVISVYNWWVLSQYECPVISLLDIWKSALFLPCLPGIPYSWLLSGQEYTGIILTENYRTYIYEVKSEVYNFYATKQNCINKNNDNYNSCHSEDLE